MNFFVNEGLAAQGSGIEHAQVQRGKLFRKNGQSFKIVTRVFNPNGHRDLLAWGLKDAEVINMYDYYAHTEYVPARILTAQDVEWGGRPVAIVEQLPMRMKTVPVSWVEFTSICNTNHVSRWLKYSNTLVTCSASIHMTHVASFHVSNTSTQMVRQIPTSLLIARVAQ